MIDGIIFKVLWEAIERGDQVPTREMAIWGKDCPGVASRFRSRLAESVRRTSGGQQAMAFLAAGDRAPGLVGHFELAEEFGGVKNGMVVFDDGSSAIYENNEWRAWA